MNTEKKTNRGLQIRDAKLKRRQKKRNEVKDYQQNICRFVIFSNRKTAKIDGKYRFAGIEEIQGLQIENRVFYQVENKLTFVFINKGGSKIIKTFTTIPEWATQDLIEKYQAFFSQSS